MVSRRISAENAASIAEGLEAFSDDNAPPLLAFITAAPMCRDLEQLLTSPDYAARLIEIFKKAGFDMTADQLRDALAKKNLVTLADLLTMPVAKEKQALIMDGIYALKQDDAEAAARQRHERDGSYANLTDLLKFNDKIFGWVGVHKNNLNKSWLEIAMMFTLHSGKDVKESSLSKAYKAAEAYRATLPPEDPEAAAILAEDNPPIPTPTLQEHSPAPTRQGSLPTTSQSAIQKLFHRKDNA